MENGDIAHAYRRKEEELIRLNEIYASKDRRKKEKPSPGKELLKAKKQVKDKEREIIKLAD